MLIGFLIFVIVLLGIIRAISRKLDYPEGSDASEYDTSGTEEETVPEPAPEPAPARPQPAAPKRVERLFGLIGKPLGHSKSMVLFKNMFRGLHISADYANFELESIDQLTDLVKDNPKLCGFNVTMPYKEAIIPLLDSMDDAAKAIGAVNTVKVLRSGGSVTLKGYNTDCTGFMESIKEHMGDRHKALILGTGGVAKAVRYAFEQMGVESRFVSRSSSFDVLGYYELSPSMMEEYTIIVNCTPLGMPDTRDQCPDIPYTFLSEAHLLFDVIYNPEETLFMKKGREHGAAVAGGQDMFELQARASWEIWNSEI